MMSLDAPATQPVYGSANSIDARRSLALVIPTYREAANLPALLSRVQAALNQAGSSCEILVVDDGSRDGSSEIVSAISATDPRVRLIVRRGQRGLSGAILHGWQCTHAAILGVMDADLQHPPELLPTLLNAIHQGNDLVIASRHVTGGKVGGLNPVRHFVSAAAICLTWPLQHTHLRARDPMSGFFLLRRECIHGLRFQQSGFKLLLEILVRGRINTVREIPFTFGLRHAGQSKATLKVAIDYAVLLSRLYCARLSSVLRLRSSRAKFPDMASSANTAGSLP